jgi:hypothetical protein
MRFLQSSLLFFVLFCCCLFCGSSADDQKLLDKLKDEIQELVEMKLGYEAQAIQAEDQANRLQFEDRFALETRRYYRIAEINREKAARIQEEIDWRKKKCNELSRLFTFFGAEGPDVFAR